MSRSVVQVNVPVIEIISIFDPSDSPVLGLITSGDFTTYLYQNGVEVGPTEVPVSVTEIGDGQYAIEFTPDSVGVWHWRVSEATYGPRGWQATYQATTSGVLAAGDAMTLTTQEREDTANAILDLTSAIDGLTLRQVLKLFAAVLLGKVTGGPSSPIFKSIDGATTRVTMSADSDGNRTSANYNP